MPAATAGPGWQPARTALAREASARDQAGRSLANRDFHRALSAGCGNPLLVRMLDDLRDATALITVASWQQDPPGIAVPSWQREAAEHQAILAAAEQGDAGRAADLLRAHIAAFFERNFTGDPRAPHGDPRAPHGDPRALHKENP